MRNGLRSNCSWLLRCATLRCMNRGLMSIIPTARVMNRPMLRYLPNTFPTTAAMCFLAIDAHNMFCITQNLGAITWTPEVAELTQI